MAPLRTQVGIVGAGPAGLLLSRILRRQGIETLVLERHSRAHVEARIRAGVLEQGTVDQLVDAGIGERCLREGLVHDGFDISFDGRRTRIDLSGPTGGKSVTIYGQTEVTKDLVAAHLEEAPETLVFEAEAVEPLDFESNSEGEGPRLRWRRGGEVREARCDVIAGCDGYHGICRRRIPAGDLEVFQRVFPFAWLGILVEAPPPSEELIYARHPRGFALFSMRSPRISRSYLQCHPDEDLDSWPNERIWEELARRLGPEHGKLIREGPVLERGITPMRSFVAEPLRHGRLFLAGDAAHIVPPTGAKGLNLAVADVRYLAEGLVDFFEGRGEAGLDAYSTRALARVWKAQRFSWWMTSLLHVFPDDRPFENRVRLAELDYVLTSEAARTTVAENYVGLPF